MWPELAAGCAVAALLLASGGTAAEGPPAEAITVRAQEYASTKYLSADEIRQIKERGYLTGFGEAEYRIAIPRAGWYELWVAAAQWATELYLDGEFVIYTQFTSGVWPPRGDAEKTVNLYLSAGEHLLRFSRPWPFGLPWMKQFSLLPARDVTGMVRVRPTGDALALRQGQPLGVELAAGKLPEAYTISLRIQDPNTAAEIAALPVAVPAGEGVFRQTLSVPTEHEGIFDLAPVDAQGRAVDRIIQYCVVGRARTDTPPATLGKRLLTTIDCARHAPDYVSAGGSHVVAALFGSYVESGPKGRVEDLENADWFAYKLDLPEVQQPYLVEVDYPDDDQRAFLISLVEEAINPYAPTLGVASGGEFSLSGQMQTHQLVFYPRQKDPRLFFQTWYRGQRAAAAQIRVYRLKAPFPVLPGVRQSERQFGFYQEEPLRFGSYFGAPPTGNQWSTVFTPADRLGQWGNYLGANLWHPTISVYQSMMWPSKVMPGYGPADSDGFGLIGPASPKEPLMKDLVRLMLLISEKYHLRFVGELHTPVNAVLARALDKQFGGTGTTEDDGPQKPWLIVSKEGKIGSCPHYNPLHPGVQDWVASVIGELAQRYKDSPAFGGVALRFMGWQFSSWQGLPSINWGYEDYTVALFEKETGITVPVAADDPQRYGKRYGWLMSRAYEPWVRWRCRKMHQYYARLAGILTAARPDLRLHLETYGQSFDTVFAPTIAAREYESKGWLGLMREAGIDPALLRDAPGIVLNDTRAYPPAIRTSEPLQAAADRVQYYDPQVIAGPARPMEGGTVSAVHFDAQSMEGEMVRADKLGMPAKMMLQNKETAHGAGVMNPAGRHFLARYADALADGNVTYMHDGSHGYDQGQPQYLRGFLAEYLSLPATGMNRLAGTGDPIAVWSGKRGERGIFYVVNRAPFAVRAALSFARPPDLERLATGAAAPLAPDGNLRLSMQGYELLAFGGGTPVALKVTAPPEVGALLERQIAFAEALLDGKRPTADVTIVPFSLLDKQRAQDALAQARTACREGRLVSARRVLMQPALVKVYEAFGAYPPDLFYRKSPPAPEQALTPQAMLPKSQAGAAEVAPAAQQPSLKLAGIIGDLRGRGLDNLSVAVTGDGRVYLLMRSGRVAVFNGDGTYAGSRQVNLTWPQENYYLASDGSRVYLGDLREDCPWALEARRAGSEPGQFQGPRGLALSPAGEIVIADTGNHRLQAFKARVTERPLYVTDLPARPLAVACLGHEVAALTDDERLRLFIATERGLSEELAASVGPGACSVAFASDGSLLVAYAAAGSDQLRRYERQGQGLRLAATIAHGAVEAWPGYFPAAVPLTTGPDAQVWFATDLRGSLCALDPRTDAITERVRGLPRPLAVAFDREGTAFVTGFPLPWEPARRQLLVLPKTGPQVARPFLGADIPLTTENVPLWGLLPGADGGVTIRVVEEGYRKGWPALAIKTVYADGHMQTVFDFGELYARRRTFAPWEMQYALKHDAQGNVLLAAVPLASVLKATPEGKILWEAGPNPSGGADRLPLHGPRDLAVDSRGNLWVVDADLNRLLCLSPEGKLLLEWGRHGGVDDRDGRAFEVPSGVAVTQVQGREFLYVGDAGNQRLVKYEISYP